MRVSPNGRCPTSPFTKKATDEYGTLVKDENLDPKIFEVAKQYPLRNRYPNILPNEATRFKMEDKPLFYFNANWVLEKTAIACQGPLQREVDDFWEMVRHADIQTIVMLANPVENNKRKCSDYWENYPFKEEILFELGKEKIVKRIIEAPNEKPVIQYHLQNWPDFKTVAPETLAKLVELVAQEEGKFLAHCSAGVGRTGTFLAALKAYRDKTADLSEILKTLRHPDTGRVGLIQTPEQYCLAKKVAETFYQAHLNSNNSEKENK